jgi:hypothetical protein
MQTRDLLACQRHGQARGDASFSCMGFSVRSTHFERCCDGFLQIVAGGSDGFKGTGKMVHRFMFHFDEAPLLHTA